jgi:hypothetical protein
MRHQGEVQGRSSHRWRAFNCSPTAAVFFAIYFCSSATGLTPRPVSLLATIDSSATLPCVSRLFACISACNSGESFRKGISYSTWLASCQTFIALRGLSFTLISKLVITHAPDMAVNPIKTILSPCAYAFRTEAFTSGDSVPRNSSADDDRLPRSAGDRESIFSS